jgi:hypothetical protein
MSSKMAFKPSASFSVLRANKVRRLLLQFKADIDTAAAKRRYSSSEPDLKTTLQKVIPAKRELLKKVRTEHGNKVIGEVKVENTIGGMR